ncbi:MAG: putative DNA binding domain-containing protein, partial [Lachnospiraceae bacterium]|nr:putative DNA binding domain-containing protein [Lachnospiraceae bacterium]
EYMQTEDENKYFDRKSAQTKIAEIAPDIAAFANADGGTLIIGISDKTRKLEGIDSVGADKINDFISAPRDCCKPMPEYQEEFVDIINSNGETDRLLLIHIKPSVDRIIRTTNDRTYLRIGDRTKEVLGENLRHLEYAKGARHFEDEINEYATIEDLDDDLILEYKKRIGATDLSTKQVLSARGFIQHKDGRDYLTNAALLLFAKNVMKFYPNCRIRFIRINGRDMQVGDKYNVVKDRSFDEPILRLIGDATHFIADQLRDFRKQDRKTSRFIESPEYPEFPWTEGIINAVTHRDYALTGLYIKVSMFDDRLEIESPGRLPSVVTVDNITSTRFSRNTKISRVLTEFELVRELNEGVKKIYSDMESAGLDKPEFIDSGNTFRLVLRNNIDMRTINDDNVMVSPIEDAYENVPDDIEKLIISVLRENSELGRSDIVRIIGSSDRTISRKLNHLIEIGLVEINGNKYDKNHTYSLQSS